MATIKRLWNRLMGRTASHDEACAREIEAADKLQRTAVTAFHHARPRPAVQPAHTGNTTTTKFGKPRTV
jgi:hypothetical protein